MKVYLSRHGGQLAGIYLGRPAKVVDADTLPRATAGHLAQLVSAAQAEPSGLKGRTGTRPDEMSYTITIEDKGRQTVLKQSDSDMTDGFRALWEWIEAHPNSGP
jgi:hypothetical protein